MPDRQTTDNQYRYAYQGQEKDPETGMEAFELRLWDGRIGRWLTVDPYGEFYSPYLGMGNDPISTIDPDGGCVGCPGKGTATDPYQLQEVVILRPRKVSLVFDLKNILQQMTVFAANLAGTVATNNVTFGIKQMPHSFTGTKFELAERLGRLGGDVVTMVQGIGEDTVAVGGTVITVGGAIVPAAALGVHGTALALGSGYAASGEIMGLVNYMSKKGHGSGGGKMGGNQKANKQFNDVVKQLKITDKKGFSEFLHKQKANSGKGGADNYSWSDLIKLGKKFLAKNGNK